MRSNVNFSFALVCIVLLSANRNQEMSIAVINNLTALAMCFAGL